VAEVQNQTAEAYFPINDLNDELLNELSMSGDFKLVDQAAREKILGEITYQNDGMVDPATAKKIGKQTGADVMIFGSIYMKPEKRSGKTLKEYSVNIRLTDIETATEFLRTRAKINKYSEKNATSW
jgi:PBP1b-binding outer membrane lipoprotein LpoB